MNWGTISTPSAVSHIHSDAEGLGTTIQLLTGEKLWFLFRQARSLASGAAKGDLGSISFCPPIVKYQDHKLVGYFTAEAILLRPRMVL
jgi:hypothetical protein